MAKTLDDLIAESEIKDVHIRFCRANDRMDQALMRSCFHPDAVIQLHETLDVDAFVALGQTILSQYTATWHNTGNQLVEVDGDTAWAEHYTTSSHRISADAKGPERDFIAQGRYVDHMEKRGGEWRIARRTMVLDFLRTEPLAPGETGLGSTGGKRDRSDPSYTLRLRD
ncbi:nuclear transport factor 2 family protein [Novosphingobium album (ex Hu et al. 2023)]|uniref:Nuclear transport factor 2 family protein n=1 Tax=Novosphingobium album (ex Hu et al. 2023) TaxID=2930093 RepID=A0ABT0AYX1_9SPHN|nr:nuclear transport factor 2 family protein [Novosphingobium album (ex Hu et al. 2023)]MCJ2178001.1 nuclear transport factor 2 family protein [Novosphingobium album (ex Hu et al. 2023)]